MDVFCGPTPGSDKFEFLETDSRVAIQHTFTLKVTGTHGIITME